MSKADYDGVEFSMSGIPDGCWREIPVEAQRRVVLAFPELRLVFNPVLGKYQCVHKDEMLCQPMWGFDGHCVLEGWEIIPGNYNRPLDIEDVVRQLRLRAFIAEEAYMKDGGIDALADRLAAEEVRRREVELHEKFVDTLGIDSWTGHVHKIRAGQTKVGYGTKRPDRHEGRIPVMDARFDAVAQPAVRGPGKKELARQARKMDAALRTGAPL